MALCLAANFGIIASAANEEVFKPMLKIHIVGGSDAVAYSSTAGETGWGQALDALLNEYALVENHSMIDASTTTFLTDSDENYGERWSSVKRKIAEGDYVLISFGANETASESEFKANISRMISEVQALNAVPVVVTPVGSGSYADYAKVAAGDVLVIDLASQSLTAPLTAETATDAAEFVLGGLNLPAYAVAATAGNIYYPNVYLDYDFEMETINGENIRFAKDNWGNTRTAHESYSSTHNRAIISLNEETSGNKTLRINGTEADRATKFGIPSINATDSYVVMELRFKMESFSNAQKQQQSYIELWNGQDANYYNGGSRIIGITPLDTLGNQSFAVNGNASYTVNKFYDKMNYGEWNSVKVILDQASQSDRKFHLILNDALICADVPQSGTANFDTIILGGAYKGCDVQYDDIRLYSVSDEKVAQMLVDGVNNYLGAESWDMSESLREDYRIIDSSRGVGNAFYLPSSVAVTNKSFLWGDTVTSSVDAVTEEVLTATNGGFRLSTTDTGEGTTSPYRAVEYISAPYGYSTTGDEPMFVKLTLNVGGKSYVMNTDALNIKRKVLNNTSEDLEIGVPRLLNQTSVTRTNGTTYATVKSSVTAAGSASTLYTISTIKNTGTETRKLIGVMAFYKDGQYLSASKVVWSEEIAPGESWKCEPSGIPINGVDGASAKFIILDAVTLQPVMNAIELAAE